MKRALVKGSPLGMELGSVLVVVGEKERSTIRGIVRCCMESWVT